MLKFFELPFGLQLFEGLAFLLLFLTYVFLIIRAFQLKRAKFIALLIVIAFSQSALVRYTLEAYKTEVYLLSKKELFVLLNRVPNIVFICLIAAFTLGAVLLIIDFKRFRKNALTAMSIQEATDTLPSGICCYFDSGRVLLVNEVMNEISSYLTGYDALNGHTLWNAVKNKMENGVLKTDSDKVYYISRSRLMLNGVELWEMIASDITVEYALNKELSEKNKQLEMRHEHLVNYGKLVEGYTIEKEMLDAKLRIHDDLGGLLIATKRFIEGKGTDDESIVSMWNVNISLLQNEELPYEEDAFKKIFKIADDLGFEIIVSGDLPENEADISVVACAMRECITNTIRHAEGDKMRVDIVRSGDTTLVSIINNGNAPEEKISETGGLSYLRRLAERNGWEMRIQSFPYYELNLTKKDGEKGEKDV